jgi:hypothetical protein
MRDKMSSFLRSVRLMKSKSDLSKDPELSFSINWCNHLVQTLRKNQDDDQFKGELVMSASDYFRNNLTDQQKVDVFCFLLGTSSRNNKR